MTELIFVDPDNYPPAPGPPEYRLYRWHWGTAERVQVHRWGRGGELAGMAYVSWPDSRRPVNGRDAERPPSWVAVDRLVSCSRPGCGEQVQPSERLDDPPGLCPDHTGEAWDRLMGGTDPALLDACAGGLEEAL